MHVQQHPAKLREPPSQQEAGDAAAASQIQRLQFRVPRPRVEHLPQGAGEDAGVGDMGLGRPRAEKAEGPGFRQDPQDLLVDHRSRQADAG